MRSFLTAYAATVMTLCLTRLTWGMNEVDEYFLDFLRFVVCWFVCLLFAKWGMYRQIEDDGDEDETPYPRILTLPGLFGVIIGHLFIIFLFMPTD